MIPRPLWFERSPRCAPWSAANAVRGPGKDCGYENVILKAITGFPMPMESKTAACAHLSPLGNIAAAACDTWSNESVQNVKLLGGMTPACYLEQLIYDRRLTNAALADGPEAALLYRKWMVSSDASCDSQAFVLAPDNAIAIGNAIVSAPNAYRAGQAAALEALRILTEGYKDGALRLHPREVAYLEKLRKVVELPGDEFTFIEQMMPELDTTRFVPGDNGLAQTRSHGMQAALPSWSGSFVFDVRLGTNY